MSLPDVTLTYDGTALNDDPPGGSWDGVYWELVDGLFDGLTTKGTDSTPPGTDGVFARPRRFLRRTLKLRGLIGGTTTSAYHDNMEAQRQLFDLKGHGDLVAVLKNGDTYTLDMRPVNFQANEVFTDALARPLVTLESYEDADWTLVPAS